MFYFVLKIIIYRLARNLPKTFFVFIGIDDNINFDQLSY